MCAARMSRSMGRKGRCTRSFRCGFVSCLTLQTNSSRCCQHLRNTNEIVGRGGEHEEPLDQAAATMPGLAQTADRLDPPEWFFDPLALDRADTIAGMPGRARIDRRAAVGVVLRDMRRAAALAATGDTVGGVIVLVGAHGAARLGIVLDHVEGGRSLRRTVGLGEARIDDQPVAVLHHQMPHVAELGLLASALAEQAGIGVGSRGMRVVLALLAMEVALGIAPLTAARLLTRWWIIAPSFGTKLFMLAHASISVPSTEKCSLDKSPRTCGRFSTVTKNLAAMSPSSRRSRFLQNTVASHTGSSIDRPTNQRNNRL